MTRCRRTTSLRRPPQCGKKARPRRTTRHATPPQAFRAAALKAHPDKGGSDEECVAASRIGSAARGGRVGAARRRSEAVASAPRGGRVGTAGGLTRHKQSALPRRRDSPPFRSHRFRRVKEASEVVLRAIKRKAKKERGPRDDADGNITDFSDSDDEDEWADFFDVATAREPAASAPPIVDGRGDAAAATRLRPRRGRATTECAQADDFFAEVMLRIFRSIRDPSRAVRRDMKRMDARIRKSKASRAGQEPWCLQAAFASPD